MHINIGKIINVKIFNNGGFQMTGITDPSQSDKILSFLTELLYEKQLIESKNIIDKETNNSG